MKGIRNIRNLLTHNRRKVVLLLAMLLLLHLLHGFAHWIALSVYTTNLSVLGCGMEFFTREAS